MCCALQVFLSALASRTVCARTGAQLRGNIDREHRSEWRRQCDISHDLVVRFHFYVTILCLNTVTIKNMNNVCIHEHYVFTSVLNALDLWLLDFLECHMRVFIFEHVCEVTCGLSLD